MARTFIGELILRLKDEMSGKAKTAASNLDTSIDRIQRAARELNQTSWGGQFEERLRKLGTSAGDIDKLRVAWDSLHTSMSSRNLGKAMQSLEKQNFKTAALGYFSDIATKAKDAETNIGRMHTRWKEAAKDMAVYGTVGTIMYGGANALRGGINASAELQSEIFKQENARIPRGDQLRIASEADRLTTLYPSAGLVNVMELARAAQSMMGGVDRGLEILPDLVKGYVALQTTKGVDAAPDELRNLLRGIDNAGKNKEGQLGIDATREIIAGMIRAAQIEGSDLDVGKLFQFARRGKISVPGLSTEFLANVSPAFMQDMTPEGFGTALSSAYQAFVIGSTAVASKKNIARQKEIGIRDDEGLVAADLFGTNPYAWVKQVLVPALKKQGVDMENETAVAHEVAQLSRNTNATGLLTRMITQQQQVDRLLEQYANAVGPGAADNALAKDPFVAWKGFTESWRELATAIKGMPEAVGILNTVTDGLQRFATALRNNDGTAQAALAGAGIAGGFAAWKITAAIWGLMTAGTNLNAAAFALEAAAASLAAGGKGDDVVDKLVKEGKDKGGWLATIGAVFKAARAAAVTAVPAVAADSMGTNPGETMDEMRTNQYRLANDIRRLLGMDLIDERNRSGSPDDRDERNRRLISPYEAATDAMRRRQAFEADTGPRGNTPGLGDIFKPQVDMGDADAALQKASAVGNDIANALSVSARPVVDTGGLDTAIQKAGHLVSLLSRVGPLMQQASQQSLSLMGREINRSFSDFGVKP